MSEPSLVERAFDADRAAAYDAQFARMLAVKDLMHLLVQVRFASLPEDAHILIVGAETGAETGAEARFLAARFPRWRFTLADPSSPMLAIVRGFAVGPYLRIRRGPAVPAVRSYSPWPTFS